MPRNSESFASKVLTYFRKESVEKITLLFDLIGPIVKERVPTSAKKVVTRKKATAAATAGATTGGVPLTE